MRRRTNRSWLLFAVVSFLWGVPYLLIDVALREGTGPLTTAAGRVLLAALVLAPFALRRERRSQLRGRAGKLMALSAVEVVIPFGLIPLGEQTISSGLAGVLIATEPMFVLLFGLIVRSRARPSLMTLGGLTIGFCGVIVLLGVEGAGPGIPLLVIAAASYGVGAVLIGRWFSDVAPTTVAAAILAIAAPVLVALASVTEVAVAPTWLGFAAVAVLGILCTAAGFGAFFALIKEAGADQAALITYVAPVIAVLCGAVLLAEPVGPRTLVAAALVFLGAWLASRPSKSGAVITAANPLERRAGPTGIESADCDSEHLPTVANRVWGGDGPEGERGDGHAITLSELKPPAAAEGATAADSG